MNFTYHSYASITVVAGEKNIYAAFGTFGEFMAATISSSMIIQICWLKIKQSPQNYNNL